MKQLRTSYAKDIRAIIYESLKKVATAEIGYITSITSPTVTVELRSVNTVTGLESRIPYKNVPVITAYTPTEGDKVLVVFIGRNYTNLVVIGKVSA
jgi:hypothetical protein